MNEKLTYVDPHQTRYIYEVNGDAHLLFPMDAILDYWTKAQKSGFENTGSEEVLIVLWRHVTVLLRRQLQHVRSDKCQ